MHMQATPQTMQRSPQYENVTLAVQNFFEDRLSRLCENGVALEQIMLDVGMGFGKTVEHNLQLLRGVAEFYKMGSPIGAGSCRAKGLSVK